MSPELLLTLLLISVCGGLLSGFPVAFVLSGVALLFALLGAAFGAFDLAFISALPNRIYGIMMNELLLAVPLFIFMGVMMQRSKIAEELLETMAELFGNLRCGLGISVIVVGALLGASTGIVGATVVTMGLISLPVMQRARYANTMSTGVICASGTLGQIIPPSIVLILLGDQISSAYQTSQMEMGNLSPEPVSIADLFVGAIIPGLCLVALYILWLVVYSLLFPSKIPPITHKEHHQHIFLRSLKVLLPPLLLVMLVLGSILSGLTTATESAAVGAVGAMVLALTHRRLTLENLQRVMLETAKTTSMIFTILIGAAMLTLVFRGYGGDEIVENFLSNLPGGLFMALMLTMGVMFLLGFFLDFIEIIYVVVPIVAPVLLTMGVHPIWLAVMIAVNLQTSFLTPPFGFSLFYLRGVADRSIRTMEIYKGTIPFVLLQLLMLGVLACVPELATWLPETLYDHDYRLQPVEIPKESYGVDF